MKPIFAMILSQEGVALLQRSPRGWLAVGEVALTHPALDSALAALRGTAESLAPDGLSTKLVIPNSEILYTGVTSPSPDPDARRRAIRRALEGATPYAVDDLVFDWSGSGTDLQVAVVARQTLDEAEGFARTHGFNPVALVARPESGQFIGEPFFGETAAGRALAEAGDAVERDFVPVQVVGEIAQTATAAKPIFGRPAAMNAGSPAPADTRQPDLAAAAPSGAEAPVPTPTPARPPTPARAESAAPTQPPAPGQDPAAGPGHDTAGPDSIVEAGAGPHSAGQTPGTPAAGADDTAARTTSGHSADAPATRRPDGTADNPGAGHPDTASPTAPAPEAAASSSTPTAGEPADARAPTPAAAAPAPEPSTAAAPAALQAAPAPDAAAAPSEAPAATKPPTAGEPAAAKPPAAAAAPAPEPTTAANGPDPSPPHAVPAPNAAPGAGTAPNAAAPDTPRATKPPAAGSAPAAASPAAATEPAAEAHAAAAPVADAPATPAFASRRKRVDDARVLRAERPGLATPRAAAPDSGSAAPPPHAPESTAAGRREPGLSAALHRPGGPAAAQGADAPLPAGNPGRAAAAGASTPTAAAQARAEAMAPSPDPGAAAAGLPNGRSPAAAGDAKRAGPPTRVPVERPSTRPVSLARGLAEDAPAWRHGAGPGKAATTGEDGAAEPDAGPAGRSPGAAAPGGALRGVVDALRRRFGGATEAAEATGRSGPAIPPAIPPAGAAAQPQAAPEPASGTTATPPAEPVAGRPVQRPAPQSGARRAAPAAASKLFGPRPGVGAAASAPVGTAARPASGTAAPSGRGIGLGGDALGGSLPPRTPAGNPGIAANSSLAVAETLRARSSQPLALDGSATEAEAMTVFGARRRAGPTRSSARTGLMLTGVLALLLGGVALWAGFFLTGPREGEGPLPVASLPAPTDPAPSTAAPGPETAAAAPTATDDPPPAAEALAEAIADEGEGAFAPFNVDEPIGDAPTDVAAAPSAPMPGTGAATGVSVGPGALPGAPVTAPPPDFETATAGTGPAAATDSAPADPTAADAAATDSVATDSVATGAEAAGPDTVAGVDTTAEDIAEAVAAALAGAGAEATDPTASEAFPATREELMAAYEGSGIWPLAVEPAPAPRALALGDLLVTAPDGAPPARLAVPDFLSETPTRSAAPMPTSAPPPFDPSLLGTSAERPTAAVRLPEAEAALTVPVSMGRPPMVPGLRRDLLPRQQVIEGGLPVPAGATPLPRPPELGGDGALGPLPASSAPGAAPEADRSAPPADAVRRVDAGPAPAGPADAPAMAGGPDRPEGPAQAAALPQDGADARAREAAARPQPDGARPPALATAAPQPDGPEAAAGGATATAGDLAQAQSAASSLVAAALPGAAAPQARDPAPSQGMAPSAGGAGLVGPSIPAAVPPASRSAEAASEIIVAVTAATTATPRPAGRPATATGPSASPDASDRTAAEPGAAPATPASAAPPPDETTPATAADIPGTLPGGGAILAALPEATRAPAPGAVPVRVLDGSAAPARPAGRPGDLATPVGPTVLYVATPAPTGARPETRPEAVVEAAAAALAPLASASELAVAQSLVPDARPANFARLVARAQPQPAPAATPTPTRTAAAAAVATPTPAPAAAAAPNLPTRASVAQQATQSRAINLRRVNLIGVFGTASDRRALVRLSNGQIVAVRVGDRLDGGQVAAIGESELRYVRGGRNTTLRIGES